MNSQIRVRLKKFGESEVRKRATIMCQTKLQGMDLLTNIMHMI